MFVQKTLIPMLLVTWAFLNPIFAVADSSYEIYYKVTCHSNLPNEVLSLKFGQNGDGAIELLETAHTDSEGTDATLIFSLGVAVENPALHVGESYLDLNNGRMALKIVDDALDIFLDFYSEANWMSSSDKVVKAYIGGQLVDYSFNKPYVCKVFTSLEN